jgi:hypothetical protein
MILELKKSDSLARTLLLLITIGRTRSKNKGRSFEAAVLGHLRVKRSLSSSNGE